MTTSRPDITESCTWEENLPRPRWDVLTAWIETHVEPNGRPAAWADLTRQWLEKLREALGRGYHTGESENFQALVPSPEPATEELIGLAERGQQALLDDLPDVAAFHVPGKQVVVILRDAETYYNYVAPFFPEGHFGGSLGAYIDQGYPHIAGCGAALIQNVLAHELTHACLCHLTTPRWLQEGLAKRCERKWCGGAHHSVEGDMFGRQKRFWSKHGLNAFWRGEGFSRPGKVQALSYQLAEVLVQLLFDEFCPRWFGLDQRPRQRLLAFIAQSAIADCGEQAARMQLGIGLGDLAARFLGPGDWAPKPDQPLQGPSVPLARPFER